MASLSSYESNVQKLDRIGQILSSGSQLTPEDVGTIDAVTKLLEGYLTTGLNGFSGSGLVLYGSAANGFGTRSSLHDIDMSFQTKHHSSDRAKRREVIALIFSVLLQKPGISELRGVTNARVPVCKFTLQTSPEKTFEIDITVDNHFAIRNSQLLKSYAAIDERAVRLVLMVKSFVKTTDLHGYQADQLNSYTWCLLVIHFLQQCSPDPVLPILLGRESLEQISKNWPGWRRNTRSIGDLFVGFLEYYAFKFDFTSTIVAIHQKSTLPKSDMAHYAHEWHPRDVSIQDPIDRTHNLGFNYAGSRHSKPLSEWFRSNLDFIRHGGGDLEVPPVRKWMESF